MILRSLTTENFRNLAPATVEFHPSVNIAVGSNGQGKTNLLEAIYFLATTKSFRTNRVASIFRFDTKSVYTAGVVDRDGLTRTQSAGLELGQARRRVLMVNGEKLPLNAYVGALSVFAYSQSRLEIVRGGPEERRRFLDRGIASIQPGYLETLSRYQRVLKQRNALLHAIAGGENAARELEAWSEEFVLAGSAVHRAREAYLRDLVPEFDRLVAEHDYHVNSMTLAYRGSGAADELRHRLERTRRHEIRARMSLAGPQRDEVELLVGGRPASEVLSGGEVKMVVLFLKLAKVALFRRRFEQPPLFLLDDVDAELDFDILQRLLSRLPAEAQVFATSAKEPFLRALEAAPHRRLTIENGAVTAAFDFT